MSKNQQDSPESVEAALEGYFDRPLSELPAKKRKIIEHINSILVVLWDELNVDQRRYCAKLRDRESHPDKQDYDEFEDAFRPTMEDYIRERCKVLSLELDLDKNERLEKSKYRKYAQRPRNSRKIISDDELIKYVKDLIDRQPKIEPHNFISSLLRQLNIKGITISRQALSKRIVSIEKARNICLKPKK